MTTAKELWWLALLFTRKLSSTFANFVQMLYSLQHHLHHTTWQVKFKIVWKLQKILPSLSLGIWLCLLKQSNHQQPHLWEKTSVIEGACWWKVFLVNEALHIHLTPQGSVFQHYLVSGSQDMHKKSNQSDQMGVFYTAVTHYRSCAPHVTFLWCMLARMFKKITSMSVISLPPEEGQNMQTEPWLHSFLR